MATTTTQFMVAETSRNGHILPVHWVTTNAKTLTQAKRMAHASRTFQGTDAHVGIVRADGSVALEATRSNGVWMSV